MNGMESKISIKCPVCNTDVNMKTDCFLNSFGQCYHFPKCWNDKNEISRINE